MGLVFELVSRFHRYWAYSSESTVRPKLESCFQEGACLSVFSFTTALAGAAFPNPSLGLLFPAGHLTSQNSRALFCKHYKVTAAQRGLLRKLSNTTEGESGSVAGTS